MDPPQSPATLPPSRGTNSNAAMPSSTQFRISENRPSEFIPAAAGAFAFAFRVSIQDSWVLCLQVRPPTLLVSPSLPLSLSHTHTHSLPPSPCLFLAVVSFSLLTVLCRGRGLSCGVCPVAVFWCWSPEGFQLSVVVVLGLFSRAAWCCGCPLLQLLLLLLLFSLPPFLSLSLCTHTHTHTYTAFRGGGGTRPPRSLSTHTTTLPWAVCMSVPARVTNNKSKQQPWPST